MIRETILKYKWHLVTIAFFIAVAVVLFLTAGVMNPGAREGGVKKVTEWALDKRLEMTKEAVDRNKAKKGELDGEVQEIEGKIKAVEEKRAEVEKEVDRRSLKELDDAWKRLGY